MTKKAKENNSVMKNITKKTENAANPDKSDLKTSDMQKSSTKEDVKIVTPGNIITESGKIEVPILPTDALPGNWIGDCVTSVCKKLEIPPAAALSHVLLRFSAELVSPFFMWGDIKLRAIFNAVIAETSSVSRIGMSCDCVAKVFEEIPDVATSVCGPLQSGEQLVKFISGDYKGNAYKSGGNKFDQGSEVRRLVCRVNEFRTMLDIAKRDSNCLAYTIISLFEKGSAVLFSKPEMRIANAHVAIVAHTTYYDFSKSLNIVQAGNGFCSCFLWILSPRQKIVPRPRFLEESAIKHFRHIIVERIEFAKKLGQMKLGKKAGKLWGEIYPELTKEIPGVVGAVIQRSDILVIRLAMIYAIAAGHSMIMEEDMRAAYALVSYSMESARIMFNGTEPVTIKEKILRALRSEPNQQMSRTEISVNVFSKNKSSDVIEKALAEMKSVGLIEITSTKTTGIGRSTDIIRLVE
jgi:hypothetical protein